MSKTKGTVTHNRMAARKSTNGRRLAAGVVETSSAWREMDIGWDEQRPKVEDDRT